LEINIKDLLVLIIKKWWVIAVCIIICFSIAYTWTNYFVDPIYSPSTTLYVGKDVSSEGIQTSDLNLGLILIDDYREIAKSKLVSNEVISELGLENISAHSLSKRIEVTQKNESRVIQISVRDTDPQRAMVLTNKVAEVLKKKIVEIMQIENVQIIDKAEVDYTPLSPNKVLNYVIAVLLGFITGLGLIILIKYFDNTIKTIEDVQKYLGLPVIGIIPLYYHKRPAN